MGDLVAEGHPGGRHAAVRAPTSVPAMPEVLPNTLYRGTPYLLAYGEQRHSIGWQDTRRGGPCFVVARINALDTIKVVERFPLTEEGWTQAWTALVSLDTRAAQAVLAWFDLRAAKERARTGIAQLDTATVGYLPQVVFLGGYVPVMELAAGKPYDLRFLEDRLIVLQCRTVDVLVEVPYTDIETIEIGGPGLVRSGGGFVGGGFGVRGAVEGMAIAAVLNGITTQTRIKTIVRVQGTGCELFVLHTRTEPEALRIELSRPLGAIRSAQGTRSAGGENAPRSPVEELAKLASMLDSGLLTREEFEQLKTKIIAAL